MKLITDKNFYKATLAIAIPIALQNLISILTNMMDTLMLGKADNTGILLSGSSLANQPFFILSMICLGLGGSSSVLSAQYYGKKDFDSVKKIYSFVIKIAFTIGLIMGSVLLIFPKMIMGLYSSNPDIILAGSKYLRIIGFAYFLYAPGNTLLCCVRSVEITKISVVTSVFSFVCNVFLNWVLIFGNLGVKPMGIEGAAIATLTARIGEFLIISIYIFVIDKKLSYKIRDFFKKSGFLARKVLKYGIPVFITDLFWSVSVSVAASILGHIDYCGGDPVAANSIANMIMQLSTVVLFGIGNASAVIVGKTIGENKINEVKRQAFTFNIVGLVFGIISAILILAIKIPIMNYYNFSDETMKITSGFIDITAFLTIFIAFTTMDIVGVLRGAGDTRFCFITEASCIWLFALPLSALALKYQLSVYLVMFLTQSDQIAKIIICLFRFRKDKWIHNLT